MEKIMSFRQELFRQEKERMVKEQLIRRGIGDSAVLEAMQKVARHLFVPFVYRAYAYGDSPLPLLQEQTISQPYVVAFMIQTLQLQREDCVLDVGTGSGYSATVLAAIVQKVYTIERDRGLFEYAQRRFRWLQCNNIWSREGDGTVGWQEFAPFGGILVSASGPRVPKSLCRQLAIGGRLIMPVGKQGEEQVLVLVHRVSGKRWEQRKLGGVRFVPLIGSEGWEGL